MRARDGLRSHGAFVLLSSKLVLAFRPVCELALGKSTSGLNDRRGPRTTALGETMFSEGSRGYGCRIWWHRHHLLYIFYMPPFVSSSALKKTTTPSTDSKILPLMQNKPRKYCQTPQLFLSRVNKPLHGWSVFKYDFVFAFIKLSWIFIYFFLPFLVMRLSNNSFDPNVEHWL